MWYDDYTMGYRETVSVTRWHHYKAGLMDHWEIVTFFQDMIDAGVLSMQLLPAATHLTEMGLCHCDGRALH